MSGPLHPEYIIFCDESDQSGRFYSDFYGGLLVGSGDYEPVTNRLLAEKERLHFHGEVKWSKVTERYLEKYRELVSALFREIAEGRVRVRIMFRQNARVPDGLSPVHLESRYFLLYYQFIKHAFGFAHLKPSGHPVRLRLFFDEFPATREQAEQFRGFLCALTTATDFQRAGILIERSAVAEVRSHDHVLLQCLDIVLGAMSFRLNDKHKEKPPGERCRGRRTIAKEQLYRHILTEIRRIRPRFNIGISTGKGDLVELWTAPYHHWSFVPRQHVYDESLVKGAKRTNPTGPT